MRELYRVKLGRYRLTRRDILIIEKLLRIYADAYEKQRAQSYGEAINPPKGSKHMRRKYADRNVVINGFRADSVKFIPKKIKYSINFEVRCNPGMWIRFTPFTTVIGGQVLYATGIELKTMKEVAAKIETYLQSRPQSLINFVDLRK